MNGKETESSNHVERAAEYGNVMGHDNFDPFDVGHPGAIRLECLAETAVESGESSERSADHL